MRFWCLVPFTIKVRKSLKGRDNWERSGSVGFHSPTIYKNSKRTTSALWSQESISATSIRHNSPTSPLNWATTKVKKWVTCSGLLSNSSNNKERKPMFWSTVRQGFLDVRWSWSRIWWKSTDGRLISVCSSFSVPGRAVDRTWALSSSCNNTRKVLELRADLRLLLVLYIYFLWMYL